MRHTLFPGQLAEGEDRLLLDFKVGIVLDGRVQSADGFLARSPKDPVLISDERYTYVAEGLESVWGIQLEQTPQPLFRIEPRWNYFGKLIRDLFHPSGYTSVPPGDFH